MKQLMEFLFLFFFAAFLSGCASSQLSRGTAASIDDAFVTTTSDRTQLDPVNTYQNLNQTAKGALIGGVTGGVVGAITPGIGVAAGAASGAILFGALGAYIDAHSTLVDRLINRGVRVFILGDQVMMVVNSSRVFIQGTSQINNGFYCTLNLMCQLIGRYVNMSVKVAAYTNDSGMQQIDCSLTQLQAESIIKYLWKHGVDTRLLYAAGYGGTHLVTKNVPFDYYNDNYRIEITFEKLPV